jgi:hypothetical protein
VEACAGDPELRRQVDRLLRANDETLTEVRPPDQPRSLQPDEIVADRFRTLFDAVTMRKRASWISGRSPM